MGFLHKQPLAKNGMAATLALLRPSGVLNDKVCRGDGSSYREERRKNEKMDSVVARTAVVVYLQGLLFLFTHGLTSSW